MARCQIGQKDCFVIFVVLLDDFGHLGQTFYDENVSIDSLTLDSPYEWFRDINFGDTHHTKTFGSKLQQLCILRHQESFQHHLSRNHPVKVKVLCENLKYFLTSITINFWSQETTFDFTVNFFIENSKVSNIVVVQCISDNTRVYRQYL
jgi:hypothetical protein